MGSEMCIRDSSGIVWLKVRAWHPFLITGPGNACPGARTGRYVSPSRFASWSLRKQYAPASKIVYLRACGPSTVRTLYTSRTSAAVVLQSPMFHKANYDLHGIVRNKRQRPTAVNQKPTASYSLLQCQAISMLNLAIGRRRGFVSTTRRLDESYEKMLSCPRTHDWT